MQSEMEQLERKIGYTFEDKLLLKRALTHTSYMNEQRINKNGNYERVEFLGDAVLEVLSSEYLYLNYPQMGEGDMTKLRAALVCEGALAKCAKELELSDYILLGKGEEMMGGRQKESIIADVMEAVIGAIFLDGGFEAARAFIHKFVLNDIEEKQMYYDAKSSLQILTQKEKLGQVHYVVVGENGPEHDKEFECAVYVADKQMGTGKGKSKKEAEQKAALEAIVLLKN